MESPSQSDSEPTACTGKIIIHFKNTLSLLKFTFMRPESRNKKFELKRKCMNILN